LTELAIAVEQIDEVIAVEQIDEVIAVDQVDEVIAVEPIEAIAIEPNDETIVTPPRRRYSCEHCTKRFSKRRRLYSHRKCHYPDRMVCALCGAVLRDTDRYSKHLTRRHGRSSSSIENEPMIPVGNVAFKCASCDFVGNNRKHLWRHKKRFDHIAERIAVPVDQRRKTPVDQRRKAPVDQRRKALLQCPDCDYSTGHRQNLDRHSKRRHSTALMFSCEYCGKAFKDTDTVRVHIRYVHENDRRYGCSMCDRRFVTSTDLHRHQRLMHYKLRLFGCERCGKRFQTMSHMERHFLIVKDCNQSSLPL